MIKSKEWYEIAWEYAALVIGPMIAVAGINIFLAPHVIAPGGLSGFTIVVNKLLNIPMDITYLVLNIPLLIIAFKLLGKELVIKTTIATIAFSFALRFETSQIVTNDLLMSTILGGMINGTGVGLVIKYGGTTGGTDLIGSILNRISPRIKISTGMLIVDLFVVVLAGFSEKKIEIALYSAIAAYITSRFIDMVLEGPKTSKTFYIITNKPNEIGEKIMSELGRGITVFKAMGMYTKEDKEVLMCVVNRREFVRVKEIIQERDEKAFVIVNRSLEVLGEGFTSIK